MITKNDLSNKIAKSEIVPLTTPLYRFYKAEYSRSTDVLPHYHELTEILIYESRMGSAFINGQEYQISPNEIHIIHPNTVHAFKIRPQNNSASVYVLQLKSGNIFKALSGYTDFSEEIFFRNVDPVMKSKREELLKSMLLLMKNPLQDMELLCRILRLIHDTNQGRKNVKKDARLLHVFDAIDGRLSEPFSLDAIAGETAISKHHLCRIFKQSTGMTLAEYSLKARIEKAQKLLSTGSMNITETAAKCGFQSLSYFTKSFRKETGKAPKAWQRASTNPERV
ncbi:MAG: helix-turn-helix domain-containing protein [Fibrobacteres bacterium]|nr:helix-turn-helix domain-containing protein [Fibrobacterota bacterium]